MTVDNGGEKPEDDPTSNTNLWSPRELAGIREEEIGESGSGLDKGSSPRGSKTRSLNGEEDSTKPSDQIDADYGAWSMRDLLGSRTEGSEVGSSGNTTPRGKKSKAGKVREEAPSGGENERQADYRSWSLRGLLGSRRSVEQNGEDSIPSSRGRRTTRNVKVASNSGSPLRHHGSPLADHLIRPVKSIMTPSATFARLRDERDEISRQTPSPKECTLRDGITLPLIGEVKWETLKHMAKDWLRNPKNLALLLWGIAVAISGAILFMVMVGMLNAVLPKKSDRDTWFEISNQILNALFTLMVLYVHPMRILHLIWLIRWNPTDIVKLRDAYCKGGLRKPHEWAHMLVVVLLLHLNCFAQYALCGLNWGYRRANRPAIGVGITLATSFGAAAAAGMYNSLSPLGKDFVPDDHEAAENLEDTESADKVDRTEKGHVAGPASLFKLHKQKYNLLEKRMSFASREGSLVENPQWEGGLFECHQEPTISILSTTCFACVMGWNLERLGFGNRYVHIATFLLLCGAPYLVFDLAAVNVNNKYVRTSLGVTGIVLCVFSLLYGGFWRIRMRERYNLPTHSWCCRQPNMSDCLQWLFCAPCSLCQEVRTAEAYDIRDDKFYIKTQTRENTPGSSPARNPAGDIDLMPVPSASIQPLPSSTMVPIKNSELIPGEQMPVDLTMLFPPPTQRLNPLLDLEAHQEAYENSKG